MIELRVNVPQIREFLNEIAQTPQKIFELMRTDVRASMSRYLNQMMESEIPLVQQIHTKLLTLSILRSLSLFIIQFNQVNPGS